MLSVFLDRKDSGHVGKLYIFRTFKKTPEKVQIIFLYVFPVLGDSEDAVPFINNKDKPFAGICINLL